MALDTLRFLVWRERERVDGGRVRVGWHHGAHAAHDDLTNGPDTGIQLPSGKRGQVSAGHVDELALRIQSSNTDWNSILGINFLPNHWKLGEVAVDILGEISEISSFIN